MIMYLKFRFWSVYSRLISVVLSFMMFMSRMFSLGCYDVVLDTLTKVKVNEENMDEPSLFPDRPGERDCHYFMRTGKCGYGSSCRYNHPVSHVPEVGSDSSSSTLSLTPSLQFCNVFCRLCFTTERNCLRGLVSQTVRCTAYHLSFLYFCVGLNSFEYLFLSLEWMQL